MTCLRRTLLTTFLLTGVLGAIVPGASAQSELSYGQYQALSWAADRLDHLAKFEPLSGEEGMFLAVGERFGTVQIFRANAQTVQRVWKSSRLSGAPEELLVADLDSDGFDDSLLCRTNSGKVYVWDLDGYGPRWESLAGEYRSITCFTTANLDADEQLEIVLLVDDKLVYVDGTTFNKEYTSINQYQATAIRCGDVDGDGLNEIVLNSGQVVDSVTGDIEWEDEQFFSRIELLDIDGDGMPEILTENEAGGVLKVFDVDYRSEVRFQ